MPLSVKAANLAKYFPAWTVSREQWSKMLMPCVSGVAIDTLLFSSVGSPLCHRYRLISCTGSHTAFRGTYLKRLWSFIEESDSTGKRQAPPPPVGLPRTYLLGLRSLQTVRQLDPFGPPWATGEYLGADDLVA